MNRSVAINQLSEQMGLTSRTLRHWESEGLFKSSRDTSGWRIYDENALLCIRITAVLRKIDIPIKDIKSVIESQSPSRLIAVIENKISTLKLQRAEILLFERQLDRVLKLFHKKNSDCFLSLDEILTEMEDLLMSNPEENNMIKVVTLPPMRVAYNIAIGVSPEDEAMAPVLDWITSSSLLGTARFFGGNVKPLPSHPGTPYGYGMCAAIPDGVDVPSHLQEMVLPGGLYAMLESSDDIGGSWKTLMRHLSQHRKYKSDRSRLCLEEHIRNDNPDGCESKYYLNLFEPVEVK
ncbi:MerR family transcriptional regulator [Paenibacillus sabinae]|uniref:MerR family transcriptional regulator n=1 Tax=Paenibacillus sabinae T27 TaxID=1268072 RepID=X4ZRC3_9BACL|nr:MerR family transcriptional regulator [Paenibacillus sabinae]AHV99652.1 MerR family transcriptional regulator [Paenibacillus sabinae T27]